MKKEVILQGKVISGSNQGKKFVNLPWVKKQIKLKLGFDPYLGTLNLHICEEKNLIETVCPDFVRSAVKILEQIL